LIHVDLHSAVILLHDPYAHVHSPGCVSAFRILEASRSILDLIYIVRSTSFDITLLDPFCAVRYLPLKDPPFRITDLNFGQFSWYMAGRVLVRFCQAAQDANSEEQTLTLRAEVEYIMCVRVTFRSWLNSLAFRL